MTWCEYTDKCGIALSYQNEIKNMKDPLGKRILKISYSAKCQENHFTCSERRYFKGELVKNLGEDII